MNKFALYILLILIFLGASRSFVTDNTDRSYLVNESNYSSLFKGKPISVILVDAYRAGLLVKSNIHRYRIVHVFQGVKEIEVRVPKPFFRKTLSQIGLSVFRRSDQDIESTVPTIPGFLLLADPAYGRWIRTKAGDKAWRFYRSYEYLPENYLWSDFQVTYDTYKEAKLFIGQEKPYYGPSSEFGSGGSITSKNLPLKWYKERNKKLSFKDYVKTLLNIPLLRKQDV